MKVDADRYDWVPAPLAHIVSAPFLSAAEVDRLREMMPGAASPEFFDLLSGLLGAAGDVPADIPAPGRGWRDHASRLGKVAVDRSPLSPHPLADDADDEALLPLFGSLWTTRCPPEVEDTGIGIERTPPMVAVVATAEADGPVTGILQVVPVSIHTQYACEWDLTMHENGAHPELMLEVWNEQPMRDDQLLMCIGALAGPELADLQRLRESTLSGCAAATPRMSAGRVGRSLVTQDDPRRIFQEFEILRTAILREPALALLRLGEFVQVTAFPSPREAELALAATPAVQARHRELYQVVGRDVFLRLQQTGADTVAFIVLDAQREPSGVLDGHRVLGLCGRRASATIQGGDCALPMDDVRGGFAVEDADGVPLALERVDDAVSN